MWWGLKVYLCRLGKEDLRSVYRFQFSFYFDFLVHNFYVQLLMWWINSTLKISNRRGRVVQGEKRARLEIPLFFLNLKYLSIFSLVPRKDFLSLTKMMFIWSLFIFSVTSKKLRFKKAETTAEEDRNAKKTLNHCFLKKCILRIFKRW